MIITTSTRVPLWITYGPWVTSPTFVTSSPPRTAPATFTPLPDVPQGITGLGSAVMRTAPDDPGDGKVGTGCVGLVDPDARDPEDSVSFPGSALISPLNPVLGDLVPLGGELMGGNAELPVKVAVVVVDQLLWQGPGVLTDVGHGSDDGLLLPHNYCHQPAQQDDTALFSETNLCDHTSSSTSSASSCLQERDNSGGIYQSLFGSSIQSPLLTLQRV